MSEYVSFLVRNLNPRLLKQIRRDAREEGISIAEVMRQILCEYYELECSPERTRTRAPTDLRLPTSTTIRLRMQPELWQTIRARSVASGIHMSVLVRQALEAHYKEVTA